MKALRQQAIDEAKLLAKHCTREEKDRLVLELIEPQAHDKCIYGLMTGSCHSDRALSLINVCSKGPYYHILTFEERNELGLCYDSWRNLTALERAIISLRDEVLVRAINIIKK